MDAHGLLCRGQPDAYARLGLVEASKHIEDLCRIAWLDTDAVVADPEHPVVFGLDAADLHHRIRAELQGIAQQVRQDGSKQRGVAPHVREWPAQHRGSRLRDRCIQGGDDAPGLCDGADLDEVRITAQRAVAHQGTHQLAAVLCCITDELQVLQGFLVQRRAVIGHQVVDVVRDRTQRLLDVVAGRVGELLDLDAAPPDVRDVVAHELLGFAERRGVVGAEDLDITLGAEPPGQPLDVEARCTDLNLATMDKGVQQPWQLVYGHQGAELGALPHTEALARCVDQDDGAAADNPQGVVRHVEDAADVVHQPMDQTPPSVLVRRTDS